MIKIKILLMMLMIPGSVFANEELQKALSLKPSIDNGEKVYKLCATCHGDKGLGTEDGSFPMIAGQHPQVIIKQLEDIRLRNRENPTMYPFSDPETIGGAQAIADVAAYISVLPVEIEAGHGDGNNLAKGKEIYQSTCFVCHGSQGEGNADAFVPRLNHQHAGYLIRQLESVKSGSRKNGDPVMKKILQDLSSKDMTAVADYISRMK